MLGPTKDILKVTVGRIFTKVLKTYGCMLLKSGSTDSS